MSTHAASQVGSLGTLARARARLILRTGKNEYPRRFASDPYKACSNYGAFFFNFRCSVRRGISNRQSTVAWALLPEHVRA